MSGPRFIVKSWGAWRQQEAAIARFETEAEARAYAAQLPDPLIDLIHEGADVPMIGVRRAAPWPGISDEQREQWRSRDDFPKV